MVGQQTQNHGWSLTHFYFGSEGDSRQPLPSKVAARAPRCRQKVHWGSGGSSATPDAKGAARNGRKLDRATGAQGPKAELLVAQRTRHHFFSEQAEGKPHLWGSNHNKDTPHMPLS